jgi:hypothetical protein
MNTNTVVGEVYEIDPFYKLEFQGMTSGYRRYGRLIGFDSEGNHVFEVGRDIQAWNERSAKMTQIIKEPAQ